MHHLNSDFLVDTHWLAQHLNDEDLVVVDCQWDVNAYLRAHIPGALMRPGHPYVKSEQDGVPSNQLPTVDEFLKLIEELRIGANSTVICYDEWRNHFATRFWWVLQYYGFKKVRLLDGGWQAWVAAGLPVSYVKHEGKEVKDKFIPIEQAELSTNENEILVNYEDPEWQILDVRSEAEYNGTASSKNKRVGHIPDAINLEWSDLLKESSQGVHFFRSEKEIEKQFKDSGLTKEHSIAVHCQAGVRASFSVFCLTMLGYPRVKLYDGSMAEWANLDHTPLIS